MRRRWRDSAPGALAARAARRAGRRGAFLAFLAVLDYLYGWSLYTSPLPQQHSLDLLLPWQAWGIAWLTAGGICTAGVLMRRDRVPYAAAVLIKTAWGLLYLSLWLRGTYYRGWVSAVIWLCFAAAVLVIAGWPEPGKVIAVAPPASLTVPPGRP